jgi:GNAT superfamily N-acetyltransferase
MMKALPAYSLLMPSSAGWAELAREIYPETLEPFTRFRFSADSLSAPNLSQCLGESGYREQVIPITAEIARKLIQQPESYFEISEFDSVEDFLERGLGYTVLDDEKVMGVAYSSLVCSAGIEVSIFVEERYRRKGVATALASRLLVESLKRGLRPNWDAANGESYRLAKKLGYTFVEAYDAYYHTK